MGILGVGVVPPVKLCPVDGLVEAIEGNLVLRGEEAPPGVLQSDLKGNLLPLPVMEDAEETEAGNEQGDDGENSSQAGNGSPHKDEEF